MGFQRIMAREPTQNNWIYFVAIGGGVLVLHIAFIGLLYRVSFLTSGEKPIAVSITLTPLELAQDIAPEPPIAPARERPAPAAPERQTTALAPVAKPSAAPQADAQAASPPAPTLAAPSKSERAGPLNLSKGRQEKWKEISNDLACLGNYSKDCTAVNQDVLGPYQLSETQKVWTPLRADTGLTNSKFFGLSEREIRAKLGIPIAGENAIVIIPFLLSVDGKFIDEIHGVNKHCKLVRNNAGRVGVAKKCPKVSGVRGARRIPFDED